MILRCRKCREVLGNDSRLAESECGSLNESSVWYLAEDELPSWIKTIVDKEGWMKGRLNCPQCGVRVGGFDFVSGQKCGCGVHLTPSVHIVKSKVDVIK